GVFMNPAFIEPFGLTLIEVLGNGLLIDPHDQQSIADALIKLVADKQLWAKCGANGLKNIHLFSWTEHCKTYLSRIASCKPMQPRWLKIVDAEHSEPGSANDFLGDMEDVSLNLDLLMDSEDRNNRLENLYSILL
ncbi:hypothetical protein Tco_0200395, partial [Tanacetum coccineum]